MNYQSQEVRLNQSLTHDQQEDTYQTSNHTEDQCSQQNTQVQDQNAIPIKRSFLKRTFGSIGPGSLRASVILLMSFSIGSGMLAIPSNPTQSGLIISIIVMFFCAASARFTMSMLMDASFNENINSYSKMVQSTLGKTARFAYDIDCIFNCWGQALSFQIIFGSLVWQVCEFFGMNSTMEKQMKAYIGIGFCILNFPISLLRNVQQLRYFSQFQILVIVCLNFSVAFYFFFNFNLNEMKNDIEWLNIDDQFFKIYASTFQVYIAHQIIFPIKAELQRPTKKRMNKIFNIAIFFEFLIYTSFMLFGYLTWLQYTQPIIYDNYNDTYFTITKILMAIGLFFTNSMNLIVARDTFLQLVNKSNNKIYFFLSVLILQLSSASIAIFKPQAKSAIGFLGGFLGLNLAVVFPGLIYFKIQNPLFFTLKNFFIFIFILLSTIIGYTGAVMSILS